MDPAALGATVQANATWSEKGNTIMDQFEQGEEGGGGRKGEAGIVQGKCRAISQEERDERHQQQRKRSRRCSRCGWGR
jgi:hypothetical protein